RRSAPSSTGSAACAAAGVAASSPSRSRRRSGRSSHRLLLCEGEEDVVEVGGVDGQGVDADLVGVEAVEQRAQRLDAAVARDLEGQLLVVAARVAERTGGRLERARVREAQADVAAGDEPLELVRGALGDDPALV